MTYVIVGVIVSVIIAFASYRMGHTDGYAAALWEFTRLEANRTDDD